MANLDDPRFDTRQAAAYLGGETPLKKQTLDLWRHQGKGPSYIKLGRLVRYRKSDLDTWMNAQFVQTDSGGKRGAA